VTARRPSTPAALRAFRPRQWVKNAAVAAPFVFALGDASQQAALGDGSPGIAPSTLLRLAAAIALFCAASSGIYVINDILDVEQDRAHPVKRRRPIASGELPVRRAAALAAALLPAALVGGVILSPAFGAVLGGYVLLQVLYSAWLKHVPLLDVLSLSAGFVLRAMGGAYALGVRISNWLLLCAFLLSFFLALGKRRHEKVNLNGGTEGTRRALAGYGVRQLDVLIALAAAGTAAAYAAYALSPDTAERFGTRRIAWTIPLVAAGLARYLRLVYRHDKGDAPENVLLTDGPLLAIIGLYVAAVLAIFFA